MSSQVSGTGPGSEAAREALSGFCCLIQPLLDEAGEAIVLLYKLRPEEGGDDAPKPTSL